MDQQQELIHNGLKYITKLQGMTEENAAEAKFSILEDIAQTLRVPEAGDLFMALAHFPDYLAQVWHHFAPALRFNSFELEADNLREKALLETAPGLSVLGDDVIADQDHVRAYIDTCFYALPKLLLLTTIFHEATFRGIPERRSRTQGAEPKAVAIPTGIADGTVKATYVAPQTASKQVQQLFSAIQKQHELPLVPDFYRGLANWPGFLNEAWQQIMPLVGTPDFDNLKEYLSYQAQMGMRKLPLTQPDISTLSAEQKESVRSILTAYRYKLLPEMLIETALMKALLDGTAEAYTSRFSVAASDEPDEETAQ